MRWVGSVNQLIGEAARHSPGVRATVERARVLAPYSKREVAKWEAYALCCVASDCNARGAHFLEIGTCGGFSTALIALSAPEAHLTSLEPAEYAEKTAKRLSSLKNVRIERAYSWDYLKAYKGPRLRFIFVDGDHERVMKDLPWWNLLEIGGLILFHDYNPGWAKVRPNAAVWGAVNLFVGYLDLEFDVYLKNPGSNVHMVGCRRTDDREWRDVRL